MPNPASPPRILVIGATPAPDNMEFHVLDTLRALGWPAAFESTDTPLRKLGSAAGRVASRALHVLLREPERLAERRIVAALARFAPDLTLVILGNGLSPKTVARMRKVSAAPIVCWCQDQMTTLGRQYLLGSGYDHVFVKDRYLQDLFSRMLRSSSFHYLPEACNPRVHTPLAVTPEERGRHACEVVMLGSTYYYRQGILEQLSAFDLRVWGGRHDWMIDRLPGRHHGPDRVMQDKGRAVLSARIALNPLHYAEVDGLNARAFELAGYGAFQVITDKPVLLEHFETGSEIVSFRSMDDLIEKLRHYLAHPEEAAAIAGRGQLRAHRDHTYEQRLREILRISLGRD